MKKTALHLPVFPNWFPFNDMLFDGHLRVLDFAGVKTRSWKWDYRGPVLFYTSGRTARPAVEAYEYQDSQEHHKVIIGTGNLVEVRELTEDEVLRMVCNFNNITPTEALAGEYKISPFPFGFFFQNLRRFERPVPFKWPAGPVKPIWTEIPSGSELSRQLKKSS